MSTMRPDNSEELDPTIANRFLAHQLSDAERVLLEAQLLGNPTLVKQLEATARFKVGLQKLRETGELDALLRPPPKSYRTFVLAAAASVIVAIAIMATQWLDSSPLLVSSANQLRGASALTISAPYALIRNRAAAERTRIERPASRQAIQLRLFPRLQAQPPYRVSLTRTDGKTVASTTVATADADRFVTVFIDSGQLQSGSYRIIVAPVDAGAAAEESYLIEIP